MVYTPEVGKERTSKTRGIGKNYEKLLEQFGIMNKDDLVSARHQLVNQHGANAESVYKELLKEMIPSMPDKWAQESWKEITLLAEEKAAYISNIVPLFDYSILDMAIICVPFVGSVRASYLAKDGITKVGDIIHIWEKNCNRDFRDKKRKKELDMFTSRIRAYNKEAQFNRIEASFNWLWNILMNMTMQNDPNNAQLAIDNAQLAIEDSSRSYENGTKDADQNVEHSSIQEDSVNADNKNWFVIIGVIGVGVGLAGLIVKKPLKVPVIATSVALTFSATIKCLYDMSVSYKKVVDRMKGLEAKLEEKDFIRQTFIELMKCPICVTNDVKPNHDVMLACGHVMHKICGQELIRNHWNKSTTAGEPIQCPMCRAEGVLPSAIRIPFI